MKIIEYNTIFKIYVGENMYDNDKLFKTMSDKSIFFHLKDFSSSHVYLQKDNKININDLDFETIDNCCKLVKKHSCRNKNDSAMVMYCEKLNLKKGKEIGEVEILNNKKVYYYIVEKN